MFDITAIEGWILNALAIGLLALGGAIGRIILLRLHIALSNAKKREMEDVAEKALTWAVGVSFDLIKAKGWTELNTKNTIVADAIRYATSRFPDAIGRSGMDTKDLSLVAQTLGGLMERKLPATAAQAMITNAALAK